MNPRKISVGLVAKMVTAPIDTIIKLKSKRFHGYAYHGYEQTYLPAGRMSGRNGTPITTLNTNFDMFRVWKVATGVIRALNPKCQVYFGVGSVGTDHTIMDDKTKVSHIFLNPVRLLSPSSWDPAMEPQNEEDKIHRVQSMIGAAVHELAHTLYTPRGDILTLTEDYETLRVFRIWEDWYINEQVVKDRLPGAKQVIRDAITWSSPVQAMEQAEKSWENMQEFETAIEYMGMALYFQYYHDPNLTSITAPDEKLVDCMQEVEGLTAELLNNSSMRDWAVRKAQYRKIADAISRRWPPESLCKAGFKPKVGPQGETSTPFDTQIETETIDPKTGKPSIDNLPSSLRDVLSIGDMCIIKEGDIENLAPEVKEQLIKMLDKLNDVIKDAEQTGMGALLGDFEITKATEKCQYHPDPEKVQKLRLLMKARAALRRGWIGNLEEGRIDTRRIPKIWSNRSSVFKQRKIINTPKATFLILIDASGSMSGEPWKRVAQVSHELFLALKANPDYVVHAWSYTSGRVHSHMMGSANVNILDVAVMDKDTLLWPSFGGGGTPAHQAFGAAAKFLHDNYKKSQRVIIHLSDLGWGDRKEDVPEWDMLMSDTNLRWCTVPVMPGATTKVLEQYQKMHEGYWHMTAHTVDEIEDAVRDFIARY